MKLTKPYGLYIDVQRPRSITLVNRRVTLREYNLMRFPKNYIHVLNHRENVEWFQVKRFGWEDVDLIIIPLDDWKMDSIVNMYIYAYDYVVLDISLDEYMIVPKNYIVLAEYRPKHRGWPEVNIYVDNYTF